MCLKKKERIDIYVTVLPNGQKQFTLISNHMKINSALWVYMKNDNNVITRTIFVKFSNRFFQIVDFVSDHKIVIYQIGIPLI